MLRPIETHEVGTLKINIYPDETGDHECPLVGLTPEDGIIFACFESRSVLKDHNPFKDGGGPEAIKYALDNDYERFLLFKYDHSGVAYSSRSFVGRAQHANWDSGAVGYILIKRTSDWADHNKRQEVAESWCRSLTTWANGWYYGYVIENADGTNIDSCWGYDDMPYCVEEAKLSALYIANKTGVKAS